jgi:formylglycine-generating enzyme required for sulfatase activity
MTSPPPHAPAPGDTLGPYRLEAELGNGGMGRVFRARDTRLGRVVAIKFIRPEFAADDGFRKRFLREAQTVSSLNHPNVCALYDISEQDGHAYLVMEYVEGETLERLLATRALSIDEARRIATDIAAALAAAHAHAIVHRDLKPGNIIVTPSGAKVLDFGLAKELDHAAPDAETATGRSGLTEAGHIIGTPAYMSPEQVSARPIDARSDVFAAGVILYEMLSGRRPFRGDTSVEMLAAILQATPAPLSGTGRAIPRDLIGIVARCLQKSPADRFASGAELHQALTPATPAKTGAATGWWIAAACGVTLVAAAAYFGWTRYQNASQAQWVEEIAVPEIARLIEEDRGLAALTLYQQAEEYAPTSRALISVSEGVAGRPVQFDSSPSGAQLYISDYAAGAGDDSAEWQSLGTTPLTVPVIPNWGYYRIRATMPGYSTADTILGAQSMHGTGTFSVELRPESETPPDMVWVPTAPDTFGAGVALPGFWLSRYEVTNAQFKRFVDSGGYQNGEYWTEPIVRDGRRLSRPEAVAFFRDRTGRPGPAGWELSAFPAGAERLPVTGISLYEAAAYAAFAGESLPTVHEWRRAAGTTENANIVLLSNFSAKGPEAVGARPGMSPFGSFDMAGNVKEWTTTADRDTHYTLGGGWDEPAYGFADPDSRPPLARDGNLGFRTIVRVGAAPAANFAPMPRVARTLPPRVTEAEYQVFAGLHRYDPSPLDARVERVVDDSPYWRRETASFRAAYAGERVLAHVFLPQDVSPPYQTVIVLGGATIVNVLTRVEDFDYPFEFILRSGRAAVIPVLKGTLERGPSPAATGSNQIRDRGLQWSTDLGRTLEYLETRGDIDADRLALYGVSMGAAHAVRFLAVYPRFKAAVLSSGGLQEWLPSEVNSWHFAPRVHTPVLMVNGRYDFFFPLETNQRVLFDALGTPVADKRHVLYDGGHRNLVTRPDLIGEILDWFDRYLGPTPGP